MKGLFISISIFILLLPALEAFGYTNLTSTQVHQRLVSGDSLILLDVREVSEYQSGHIAEPPGQLPLTPVNLPLNSNVLAAEYTRLPQNIDIVVYCGSGRRSISASDFLESNGLNRIFNMTSGFSSWTFDKRNGGYGDHSGKWVSPNSDSSVMVTCVLNRDTSKIIIPPKSLTGAESTYLELHLASALTPIPPEVPVSDLHGLFRITALDPFGLSLLIGDSLTLTEPVHLNLLPNYPDGRKSELRKQEMTVYIPGKNWQPVVSILNKFSFEREEQVLRRWYNLAGFLAAGITPLHQPKTPELVQIYPNPFNSAVKILTPKDAAISIFDIQGHLIHKLNFPVWKPESHVASGIYLVNVQFHGQSITRKVTLIK